MALTVSALVAPRALHTPEIHPNILAVESGRPHNTDLRFGSVDSVRENRRRMRQRAGLDRDDPVYIMEAKCEVGFVDLDTYQGQPNVVIDELGVPTDGFITRERGVGLMVNVADCNPVVLYAPGVLGLAHVGRLGAAGRLLSRMVLHMINSTPGHLRPSDFIAYFGPAIAPESYVLPERRNPITHPDWDDFITETDTGYEVDVRGFAAATLRGMGVHRVLASPVDVGAHPGYFSHSVDKDSPGRNGFLVTRR